MISRPTLTGTIELALPEFDAPPADPMPLLVAWVETAEQLGIVEPYNVALATSDEAGRPSNRMVLAKSFDVDGMTFASSSLSRKGHELAVRPYAAATIFWRETRQQLRLSGSIEQLPDAESDAIWGDRPVASQASATASHQSAPLDDESAFRSAAAELALAGAALPRPATWVGYRLVPDELEFWHGSVDRMHRRLRYLRTAGGWTHERLQP